MSADFYSEKMIKARKEHKCEICGITISPGEKYIKKAGVSDGEFWYTIECEACQPTIHIFCLKHDQYNSEGICEWWRDERCPNCKKAIPPCQPSSDCSYDNSDCPNKDKYGRCEADDNCDKMTRNCWCDEYDPIYQEHIANGKETVYDLAEKYLGSRYEWESIEKINGKWRYAGRNKGDKIYKYGEIVWIPTEEDER